VFEITKGIQVLAKHTFISSQSPDRIFYDLRGVLKQKSLWYAAYLRLYSSMGSQTAKTPETIDDLTISIILKVYRAVLKNEYVWTAVRETNPNYAAESSEVLELGNPTMNDRLVQEVIRSIIEPIFESGFSNNSHGFRSNSGCPTALNCQMAQMKDCIWFIQGDLKSSVSTTNPEILMKMLERKVQDPTILNIIRTGLKAKVLQEEHNTYRSDFGTYPQGSTLSALLSNIYLDALDKFMEELCDEVGYLNIKYLRHGNHFITGVSGSHSMAMDIGVNVRDFLKEKLYIEFEMNKTKIIHISKGVPYLYYIFTRKIVFVKETLNGIKRVRKKTIPLLNVNADRLIPCLSEVGFCNRDGTPVPAFRYLKFSQSETNKKVNFLLSYLKGLCSIALNRATAMARFSYIIRYSVAKVYAAKLKLKTVAAVFKIGGNNLASPIGKRLKSVVGGEERGRSSGKKVKLTGILYDRKSKIYNLPQAN